MLLHAAFSQAREGLKEVLAELRDLAHGIHPAMLSQASDSLIAPSL